MNIYSIAEDFKAKKIGPFMSVKNTLNKILAVASADTLRFHKNVTGQSAHNETEMI